MTQPTVTFCEPDIDALGAPVLHVRVVADNSDHGKVALCGTNVGSDVPAAYELPVCETCASLLR